MTEYRGARGSNTGDDFHELWAARLAIGLLDGEGGLEALTLEGVREKAAADTWDGVDCALYFDGPDAASARRVRLEQLKYSGSSPQDPWTVARLTYSRPGDGTKPRDGSVIARLAKAWKAMRDLRPGASAPEAALVSNQPAADDLVAAVARAAAAPISIPKGPARKDEPGEVKLARAAGLSPTDFQDFAASLDLVSSTGSRFALEDRVLAAMSAWTDEDVRIPTLQLLDFIRRRMLPGETAPITREAVLHNALGASDVHALFPCPPNLKAPDKPVRRAAVAVASDLLAAHQLVCLHGEGGVGKTTALRQVEADLPPGSVMVTFDCYGGGRYLEAASLRHRPGDAFTQMANEVGARFRLPLLIRRHGNSDFPRLFMHRLRAAADVLTAAEPGALLVVAVDAADNSVTAAGERQPVETSFIYDFLRLGAPPGNVRFIVTARTGRLGSLGLPDGWKCVPLKPFTREETAEYVQLRRDAPEAWIDEFHRLSGGVPRVQAYAFEGDGGGPDAPLERLRPGKSLAAVFEGRFREALDKNGRRAEVAGVCAGLVALARPVPLAALAAVLALDEGQVRDICRDLAPGVRIEGGSAALADEDFEAFVRERGTPEMARVQDQAATWLLSRASRESYAALNVAPALAAAGRFGDLLALVEREPVPQAVQDPIQQREAEVQRLRLALSAARAAGDLSRSLRYILLGAEGVGTDKALRNLLADSPDLAARSASGSVGRLFLSDPDQRPIHGRLLYHRLVAHAERGDAIAYGADRRLLDAWNDARRSPNGNDDRDREKHWRLDADDVAADAEAALKLHGPGACLRHLRSWRPPSARVEVGLALPPRLVAEGRADDVEALLGTGRLGPTAGVFLRVPLALAGREVDTRALERGVVRLCRMLRGGKPLDGYLERDAFHSRLLDLLLLGCEILTARDPSRRGVDAILDRLLAGDRLRIDRNHLSNPVRLDVMFRALALREVRAGRSPTAAAAFEPRPPQIEKEKGKPRRDEHGQQHDRELREFAAAFFPCYAAVARALAGLTDGQASYAALRKAIGAYSGQKWGLERAVGFDVARARAARNVLALLAAGQEPGPLMDLALQIDGDWKGGYVAPDDGLVSRLSLRPELHGLLVTLLAGAAAETSDMRLGARQKSETLVRFARLLLPLSPDDAAQVFRQAVDAAGELDTEVRGQLVLIGKLVQHASGAVGDRRGTALALGEVVADAAIRLQGERHFPWRDAMGAQTRLDPGLALAAASRWDALGTSDLWETLPPVLLTALDEGSLRPGEAAGLALCLESDDGVLEASLAVAPGAATDSGVLREEAARDMLLRPGRARRSAALRAVPARDLGPLARLVLDQERFEEALEAARPKSATSSRDGSDDAPADRQAWTLAEATDAAGLAAAIRRMTEAAREGRRYLSLRSALSEAREVVPVRDRVRYLDAVVSLDGEHSRGEIVRALTEAVDAWRTPAVDAWCVARMPDLVQAWLPALSAGKPYGQDEITPLLARAGLPPERQRDLLLGAVQHHVDALVPDALLALVGLIASLLPASDVADLLEWYVQRLFSRIPTEHLEAVGPPHDIPVDASTATGRFLMAQMGSPDTRARWRAAHAVRRLARTGDHGAVHAFVAEYRRAEEPIFSGPVPAYYPLAARLWASVALDRMAGEYPHLAAAAAGRQLLDTALDNGFPHLLMRAFARDACRRLSAAGVLSPTPDEAARLAAVNESPLARIKAEERYRLEKLGREQENGDRRFHFDSTDTLPNWYTPMLRAFAEPAGVRFLDAAEHWIVDAWGWDEEKVGAAPKLRSRFRRGTGWSLSHRGHGSMPVVEPLNAHLEWHAMWCAAGELLKTVPLAECDPDDDWDDLGHRIRRSQLSESSLWATDLLVPTPLHPRHWRLGDEPLADWVQLVTEADHRTGMFPPEREGYVTIAGIEETTGPDRLQETVFSSALVGPDASPSLLRALQTMEDPWDYKLPEEGEKEFEFDEPPHRLLGWLRRPERGDGIDEHDPFGGHARYVTAAPGHRVRDACALSRDPSGAARWHRGTASAPMFIYEVWGERLTDDNQCSPGTRSTGQRLLVHRGQLQQFLQGEGMDLVVEVEVRRNGRRPRRYTGEEDAKPPEARFDRVYCLVADGSLHVAEGRLGAWAGDRPQP